LHFKYITVDVNSNYLLYSQEQFLGVWPHFM